MCQAFHSLPKSGGILDQDAFLVVGMRLVLLVQQEKWEADNPNPKGK
jgi:hypothetical protein